MEAELEKQSRQRLAALRDKYSKQRNATSFSSGKSDRSMLAGHDLAPTNWKKRLLSFGGGSDGQLGSSALLDNSKISCLKTPCWVSLEAAEGAYDAFRTPQQIASGSQLTLAVMEDGKIFIWGSGYLGYANDKTPRATSKTRIPRCINKLNDVKIKMVAAGYNDHCMVLSESGLVYSWGEGINGKLGHGNEINQRYPKQIIHKKFQTNIISIACGEQHSMALTKDGKLYSWGSSKAGQLGHGDNNNDDNNNNNSKKGSLEITTIPTLIDTFVKKNLHVLKIASGMNHSCAITCNASEEILADIINMNNFDGVMDDLITSDSIITELYTWGYGEHGRLGNGILKEEMNSCCEVPTLVQNIANDNISILDVAAGSSHTIALTSSGTVMGWGNNEFGQVGVHSSYVTHDKDGASIVLKPSPIQVGNDSNVKLTSISCGFAHSSAITSNNYIYVWGWNEQGQLGLGDEISRYEPTLLEIMNCVKSIGVSLGRAHTSIIVEQRPGHSVDALNASSGIKSTNKKKIDPIAQMREEKARKLEAKKARKRAKLEKKKKKLAEQEALRKIEEAKRMEELRKKQEAERLQLLKEKEEEEEKRQETLRKLELEKQMKEKLAKEQKAKEDRLFQEKVRQERLKAEREFAEQQRQERLEKQKAEAEARRIRMEQEAIEKERLRIEKEKRDEELRIQRKKERDELDRLQKIEEEKRRKEQEEEELLRRQLEIEKEKALKRKKKEEERKAKKERERLRKLEEEKEEQRKKEEKRRKLEQMRLKREKDLKEQQAKRRREAKEKEAKTRLEKAERLKRQAEAEMKEKERRAKLTAARKLKEKERRLAEQQKAIEDEAYRKKREDEMREKELKEKERRRKAAAAMKKKKLEQKKAKMLYDQEQRQDLENAVKKREEIAERMRLERLEQARARRKEKEALHKLLVSTYNKSAIKLKADLESEEEMKIKRRKEAAEWMKKKYMKEKNLKQKARKIKRKSPRTDNGWMKTNNADIGIPEIQEAELPIQVLKRLDLISIKDNPPPPSTAPTGGSSSRGNKVNIQRELRPVSSRRMY